MRLADPACFLTDLFACALDAADPVHILPPILPSRPDGRVVVVGAGKASARMAEALEAHWGPCEGLVITRYGHARPTQGIRVIEAGHPLPDAAGVAATADLLQLVSGLGPECLLLVLLSGGASALLVAPAPGVTLAEKQAVTTALLASGAPIGRMNILRKHLSAVKGGQLAAATRAEILCLMISDVPGDDPAVIGSGPTVGESSTQNDARAILAEWGIIAPPAVQAALAAAPRVIPPGDPRLARVTNRVIAAPAQSLAAAATFAQAQGVKVQILGDAIEGEARDVARAQAALALDLQRQRPPGAPPLLLLSGGELTVTRRGNGIGGPNAEFCLSLGIALKGATGIHALACDTDGIDGAAEVAGALIGPDMLARAARAGLNSDDALAQNDSHRFFAALGAQVITGPTLTNVNDFRAILIQS